VNYNITIDHEATIDLQHIIEYYEEISEGLGFRLLEDFEDLLLKLGYQPQTFGFFDANHRKALLKKFPIIIFFEIVESNIVLARIRHAKMDNRELFS
jgi:plasmid stabilization system protein ParE